MTIIDESLSRLRRSPRSSRAGITTTRKFYPCPVHMLYDEQSLIDKTVLHPGDAGDHRVHRRRPVLRLRGEEVDGILRQIEEKKEKVKPKVVFGETVKDHRRPVPEFQRCDRGSGSGKLKVSVSIFFGRSAPVELEYWQVERG